MVEAIFVAGLISISMTLLLPAIEESRDAARRESCKNNLKRIGLALHNYHDTYRCLPPGWSARYLDGDSRAWTGWQWSLMPYLEQGELYATWHEAGAKSLPEWPTNTAVLNAVVPVYRCPADTTLPQNEFRGGFSTANYSGNGGFARFPRWFSGDAELYWPGVAATEVGRQPSAGIFHVNSSCGMRNITDGTSNTLFVSERCARSGAGLWMGVRANRFENDVISDFSHSSRINQSFSGTSSFHSGGVMICLADGAVRFLTQNIESKADGTGMLQRLAGTSDGQVIGDF